MALTCWSACLTHSDQAIDEWYHEYSPGVLYHLAGAFASFSDALQPLA